MQILELELHNFRSYELATIRFEPGVNVLVGPNGGERPMWSRPLVTSPRSAVIASPRISPIRKDCDQAILRATASRGQRNVGLEIAINPGRANRLQVSGIARSVDRFRESAPDRDLRA